jgi:hypothetical protein
MRTRVNESKPLEITIFELSQFKRLDLMSGLKIAEFKESEIAKC